MWRLNLPSPIEIAAILVAAFLGGLVAGTLAVVAFGQLSPADRVILGRWASYATAAVLGFVLALLVSRRRH